MLTGYKHEMTEEGLLIRNVKTLRPLSINDREELANTKKVIDKEFMLKTVSRFKEDSAKGRIFDITLNHRGKRKGRIVDRRLVEDNGEPVVVQDMLITDPETQQRWLRKEIHELSADINLETDDMYATSILDEGYGYFGFEQHGTEFIPETQLSLKESGINPEKVVSIRYSKEHEQRKNHSKLELTMDAKEFETKLEAFGNKILKQVDEKLASVKPVEKDLDPMELAEKVEADDSKRKLELSAMKSKQEADNDINEKVLEGIQKGIKLTAKQYRLALAKCETQRERDIYHQHVLSLSAKNEDINLELEKIDGETPAETAEILELKKTYKQNEKGYKEAGVDEKTYIESIQRHRRGDNFRSNRNPVRVAL